MSVTISYISSEIEERKARIDKIKMDLIKEEAVLEYLLSKSEKPSIVAELQQVPTASQTSFEKQVTIDLARFAASATANTFPSDVWAVVSQFGTQEFTAPLVHDVMMAGGYIFTGKAPKGRISVELAKLAEAKKIIRTFEGKGSTPHRYVLA